MLLTPQLRAAFAGAGDYFIRVADRCPFPAMKAWLQTLTADCDWDLALHRAGPEIPEEWTDAGIRWWSDDEMMAEIRPAEESVREDLPRALRQYYALVDGVSWMPFGSSGGLYGAGEYTPLTDFGHKYHGADICPSRTFVFGSSYCGDMLIYTDDGRGGWLCHGNGKIHFLGTIEEMIEWVYSELHANRHPNFDHSWT
jgi:hypothetical protein